MMKSGILAQVAESEDPNPIDFLVYSRLRRLWSTAIVPNIFHSIGITPKLIPEKNEVKRKFYPGEF